MLPELNFTQTEWKIYQFILANKEKIVKYTLRQLALKLDVSPASIVRTMKKMGYDHYANFKEKITSEISNSYIEDDITFQAQYYFQESMIAGYTKKIELFKKITKNTKDFIFYGIGTSTDLASYGARQFVNNGRSAFVLNDPFYPLERLDHAYDNKCLIALSVSGETNPTVEQVLKCKNDGAKIVSITNNSNNTIAKLSDLNFSYFLESKVVGRSLNLTTQIPVIYILERLSRSLQK